MGGGVCCLPIPPNFFIIIVLQTSHTVSWLEYPIQIDLSIVCWVLLPSNNYIRANCRCCPMHRRRRAGPMAFHSDTTSRVSILCLNPLSSTVFEMFPKTLCKGGCGCNCSCRTWRLWSSWHVVRRTCFLYYVGRMLLLSSIVLWIRL